MVNRLDTINPARRRSGQGVWDLGDESRRRGCLAFLHRAVTVVRPVRRVNVDLTQGMLRELDERAARLNVSRQAVSKTLLRQALERSGPRRRALKRQAG